MQFGFLWEPARYADLNPELLVPLGNRQPPGRHKPWAATIVSSPISAGEENVVTDPSWARVCGPLEPYAEGFRIELERLGYTPLTAAGQVRLVAHLSRWLDRAGLGVSALSVTEVYLSS